MKKAETEAKARAQSFVRGAFTAGELHGLLEDPRFQEELRRFDGSLDAELRLCSLGNALLSEKRA